MDSRSILSSSVREIHSLSISVHLCLSDSSSSSLKPFAYAPLFPNWIDCNSKEDLALSVDLFIGSSVHGCSLLFRFSISALDLPSYDHYFHQLVLSMSQKFVALLTMFEWFLPCQQKTHMVSWQNGQMRRRRQKISLMQSSAGDDQLSVNLYED
nr:hypothetical protein Iba_chr11eCG0110 [Ipomoea batatas]